jgi:hypothetical protein
MGRIQSRTDQSRSADTRQMLNPGDEVPPGTPGTGEAVCPQCRGTGGIGGSRRDNCGGSGRIVQAIGGA